ncbi:MAG: alpha-L-arabinofuranosidase C-terminal domain-containing protein [Planctomycetota bacterium]
MKAKIEIDPAKDCIGFDRMIFGQFIEHFHRQIYGGIFEPGSSLSDGRGFRKDVIAALRELKVPVVRWPGGCFASGYHWYDGVGVDRPAVYDKAWRVEDPNTFGTDEFVMWCRAIGAEPYICTNAGSALPEESSDWVEYCNLNIGKWGRQRIKNGYPQSHKVKYWSIGNENYGAWEIGSKGATEWVDYVCEAGKMMRKVDPDIKLFAAATPSKQWMKPLLRGAGWILDYISVHGYWDPLWSENNPLDYRTCMIKSMAPEKLISMTEMLIAEAGVDKPIKIAIDEWNLRGWHHPNGNSPETISARDKNDINSTYTMADAVFSAVFLNSCLRHAGTVTMANMAPVVNTRGPLYVHPRGIVKRTTYHVLKMYSDMLAEQVMDSIVESDTFTHEKINVPTLDAVVTCDEGRNKLVMALVNRHPTDELVCEVLISGKGPNGSLPATVFSADSVDAFNDVDRPNRAVPHRGDIRCSKGKIMLPGHSVTICEMAGI